MSTNELRNKVKSLENELNKTKKERDDFKNKHNMEKEYNKIIVKKNRDLIKIISAIREEVDLIFSNVKKLTHNSLKHYQ